MLTDGFSPQRHSVFWMASVSCCSHCNAPTLRQGDTLSVAKRPFCQGIGTRTSIIRLTSFHFRIGRSPSDTHPAFDDLLVVRSASQYVTGPAAMARAAPTTAGKPYSPS